LEQAEGLFVVANGRIRVFQQSAEGREQVMHIATAESLLKLLYSITAEGHEVTLPDVRGLKLYADMGVYGPHDELSSTVSSRASY
jgi:CRP-like cAMP-binding protein